MTYVKPAASTPLSVAVTGNNITVTLATDAAGDIVSTANDVKNIVNSNAVASALVEAKNIPSDSGDGIVVEMAQAALVSNAGVTVADGVLFNDVELTYGPRPGALLIAGNVNSDNIPAKPTTAQMATMKRITFMGYMN